MDFKDKVVVIDIQQGPNVTLFYGIIPQEE